MESILTRVRDSCAFVKENARDVKIDEGSISDFIANLSSRENLVEKMAPVTAFPLKFDTPNSEINFYATLDLLNFASGYRRPLHKFLQRGAYESMCYGMMSMQLARGEIDAGYMASLSISEVVDHFQIPMFTEKQLQPGITISQPSELRPLAEQLLKVLNDTGRRLLSLGCKDFATFILKHTSSDGEPPVTAAPLVQALVENFDAFADAAEYDGRKVYILKKAQLLAADLYRKYADSDPRFRFTDIDQLTVFADNVLPAVLRKLGILKLSDELASKIDAGQELTDRRQETELRAIAVAACDQIVAKAAQAGVNFNAMQLDYYLWQLGKERGFRELERHATRDTVFY